MYVLVCIAGLGALFPLVTSDCPSTVMCITSDSPESCEARNRSYAENVRFNDCCPGCIEVSGFNETCADGETCAPGYACAEEEWGLVCLPDETQECFYRQITADPDEWKPDCLPDGTYAPKQCKGERLTGRCFCYDPDGNRIFGETNWSQANNMTCGCSRRVWEEMQTRPDVSLHCNDLGNYEELQCDNGVCWCTEELSGRPLSVVVPAKMMRALPCYDFAKHGDEYLRQCDSQRITAFQAEKMMTMHGTSVYFPPVKCNYDGSYHRVQIVNNKQLCVDKEGNKFTEWTIELSDKTMNCNCDYDQSIATGAFIYTCLNNGNYAPKQYAGEKEYCVDDDGFNIKCE